MPTFGYQTIGAVGSNTFVADRVQVCRYTANEPGLFTSLLQYLVNGGTAAQELRLVAYASDGPTTTWLDGSTGPRPGTRLSFSDPFVVDPTGLTPPTITGKIGTGGTLTAWPDGWVAAALPGDPFDAGEVWLGWHGGPTGGNVSGQFDSPAGGRFYWATSSYLAGPPAVFPAGTTGSITFSTYAVYSSTAAVLTVPALDAVYNYAGAAA